MDNVTAPLSLKSSHDLHHLDFTRLNAEHRCVKPALLILATTFGLIGCSKPQPQGDVEAIRSMDRAVYANANRLATAAAQYYMENRSTIAPFNQLVGPTNYIKAINVMADESYPSYYTQGVTITITGAARARTITYSP
jgi:hypothetical protein